MFIRKCTRVYIPLADFCPPRWRRRTGSGNLQHYFCAGALFTCVLMKRYFLSMLTCADACMWVPVHNYQEHALSLATSWGHRSHSNPTCCGSMMEQPLYCFSCLLPNCRESLVNFLMSDTQLTLLQITLALLSARQIHHILK